MAGRIPGITPSDVAIVGLFIRDRLNARSAAALEARAVAPAVAARLAHYGMLVLEGNRRLNLSGAKTPVAIVDHLADSLTVLPYVDGAIH